MFWKIKNEIHSGSKFLTSQIMKIFTLFLFLIFILSSQLFAQKIGETGIEAGFNKPTIPHFDMEWNHNSTKPAFLNLGILKSWYNENSKISFRKELGISLQYQKIDLSGGGLGAGSSYSGNITCLFISPALLAHFKVSPKLTADVGPSMDYLIAGLNHLTQSSYSVLPGFGGNGEKEIKGINRDYFHNPAFGIKARLTNISVEEKVNIGIAFTYLWTKSGNENFNATNYTKISFYIGFKKSKQPKEEPEAL